MRRDSRRRKRRLEKCNVLDGLTGFETPSIPATTHGLAQKQSSIPIKRLQVSNSAFTQIYHFEIQMLTHLVFRYTEVDYLQYQHNQPTHILGYTFRDPNKQPRRGEFDGVLRTSLSHTQRVRTTTGYCRNFTRNWYPAVPLNSSESIVGIPLRAFAQYPTLMPPLPPNPGTVELSSQKFVQHLDSKPDGEVMD
jgi:hypothetical protein